MANPNKAAVGFGYDLKQRIEEKVKSYPKGKTYTDLRDLIAADIESITGESIDKNMLHGRIKIACASLSNQKRLTIQVKKATNKIVYHIIKTLYPKSIMDINQFKSPAAIKSLLSLVPATCKP